MIDMDMVDTDMVGMEIVETVDMADMGRAWIFFRGEYFSRVNIHHPNFIVST